MPQSEWQTIFSVISYALNYKPQLFPSTSIARSDSEAKCDVDSTFPHGETVSFVSLMQNAAHYQRISFKVFNIYVYLLTPKNNYEILSSK